MSNNPEELQQNTELGVESTTAAEQLEKVRNTQERAGELSPRDAEKSEADARFEALESAVSVEGGSVEQKRESHAAPVRRGAISKKQKNASFNRQMKEVQSQLSPTSRTFSKIIHAKTVEKASDTLGATIARPNAILAGAITAFVLTLAVYVIAKNIGYSLSGFETIAAFILGWIIGILYDYLRILVTGKPN